MTATKTATESENEFFVHKPGKGQIVYRKDRANKNGHIGYGKFTDFEGKEWRISAFANDLDFVICDIQIAEFFDKSTAEMAKALDAAQVENQRLREELAKKDGKKPKAKAKAAKVKTEEPVDVPF